MAASLGSSAPAPGKNPEFILDSLGRKRYPHKYKFGKPDRELTVADLQEALDHGKFASPLRDKSYVVCTFWIGARKGEPLKMVKEDIHQEGDSLFLKIPAFKFGLRGGEIELPLSFLGVEFVKERWMKTRAGRKIWNMSLSTAWRIIKRLWPEETTHTLRYGMVTKLRRLRDAGKITTDDIKSYTGIRRDKTIEDYGLRTQAGIHKVSNVLSEKE